MERRESSPSTARKCLRAIRCVSSISTQNQITSSPDLLSQWQEYITRYNKQTGVILAFPRDTFKKTGLRDYRHMHRKRLSSGFIVCFSFLFLLNFYGDGEQQ